MNPLRESRRAFLKKTAAVAAATSAAGFLPAYSAEKPATIAILQDVHDSPTQQPPVQWALEQLRGALAARGFDAFILPAGQQPPAAALSILAATANSHLAQQVLDAAKQA